jgi:hypothetical protein
MRFPVNSTIESGMVLDIYIGDPKVKIDGVLLDTGSGLTAIPCKNCVQCLNEEGNTFYNHLESYSSQEAQCVLSHSFREKN